MTTKLAAALPLYALGGAGAILWGVAGWRAAHPPLSRTLQQALARAYGVQPEAVSIGTARLGWPARLTLTDVATGEWAAARIEVDVDPWAALGGRLKPSRLGARQVVSELGSAGAVEATLGHGRARVALADVELAGAAHWLGGLPVRIGEAGLELRGGAVERLAFTRAAVGGVGELAGAAVRAPDGGWLVRAARPGLVASARLDGDGGRGRAELDRLALATLPAPRGLDLSAATASGTIAFDVDGDGAHARTDVSLAGVAVDHRAVASRRLEGLAARVDGELDLADGGLEARTLRVHVGRAAVVLDGRVEPGAQFDLTATLPTTGCADLLASLPRALVPHLDGLVVDGTIGGRLHVAGDAADTSQVALALDGTVACRALSDPPLADVAALARPNAPALTGHTVLGRPFPLVPSNPSWRALDTLPPPVVRAFLVSEDGRFFVHHGFDVDRIGHALAADLDAGRFDRGASTITQQVAKNLFLSGERSIGRKLEEAVLAWRLEQVLDKRRILELYLNLVELGPGVYGIADAAERYFGKQPEELSVDEAAQLAALLPAPRRGMDALWQRRYRALAARLPNERVPMPLVAPPLVKLTRR